MVRIPHSNFELFIINLYVPKFKRHKEYIEKMEQDIIRLAIKRPNAHFIIAGDFNTKDTPFKILQNLSVTEYTFFRKRKGKQVRTKTDWIFSVNAM